MVQAKINILAAAVLLLASCAGQQASAPDIQGQRFGFTWQKHPMDGSRTGVTAVVGTEVEKALGSVAGGVYKAPNGRTFSKVATPVVAEALLSYQDTLAPLKQVIGYSTRAMKRKGAGSELACWSADAIAAGVEASTGKKVDLALINTGGIRIDMPQGDVLMDDISSMFPFRNYLSYVKLKGSDVRTLLAGMARKGRFQCLSGVKIKVVDGVIKEALIGGKPLDNNATYGLGTIDFLLDGGDNFSLARNAQELIITDVKVLDWMKTYIAELTAAGKNIECNDTDRIDMVWTKERSEK